MTITPYVAKLNDLWSEATAPRAADAPTVVSTFAGVGGSSLGYHAAGFDERLVVEWDANAVAHLQTNFPHVPVYHGDIAKLSVDEALHLARVAPGKLDVLDGSPPCQGFSTNGQRLITDSRNKLYQEFARLLEGLAPRAFVMENVSGMVKGKMRATFVAILGHLKGIAPGYDVSARLLNAKWYGVPQSRERIIFIGVRRDLNCAPSHPLGDQSLVTVGDAIDDISATPGLFQGRCDGKTAIAMRPFVSCGQNLAEAFGHKEYGFSFSTYRLTAHRPSNTICKKIPYSGGLIHYNGERNLADRELARLCSFPDQFQLLGTYTDRHARLGNSVPPLFACAIARHMRTLIKGQPCV